MKTWLKSSKFWVGVVAGTVAGSWALGKVGSVTGVSVSVPRAGNGY